MTLILVVLVALSGFFSSSETAFSSVNLIRLRQYAEEGRPGAKKALSVAERFDDVLLAILIGNNIVNTAAASIATVVASDIFEGASGVALATVCMTVVIIIFGEILPKSYAKENAELLTLKIGGIFYYLVIILTPLIKIFQVIKRVVSKLYSSKDEEPSVTEDELNVIIDTMEEEGVLQQEEVEMLQSVLDLSDTFVKDIMTPRVDIVAINLTEEPVVVKDMFLSEKFSRIPVYDETKDNIVGLLYERDFLTAVVEKGLDTVSISELMKEPMFVSYSMRVSDLLARLQIEKQHLVIVADEYGGTAGLVTMEDVLEELVGEIYDEHDDEEEQLIVKKEDDVFEVKSDIDIDELFDMMGVDLAVPEDAHTLGSWIYSKIEDIPDVGDLYKYHHLIFTVVEVEDRRIKRVKIEVTSENKNDGTSE